MTEMSILSSMDMFFFYGDNDLGTEIESDLIQGISQPRRSLFYNRSDGCGLLEKENYPNALLLSIGAKYDIVNWVGRKNSLTGNGQNGTKERRIAVSQKSINFVRLDNASVSIDINYIPLYNFKRSNSVNLPISKGGAQ